MFWIGLLVGLIVGFVIGCVVTYKCTQAACNYLGSHPEEMDKLVDGAMKQALERANARIQGTQNPFSTNV